MSRHGRRSGGSHSSREDDLRVSDLINEFQSLEEHEIKSFFSTLVNNQDIQGCIFRVIARDRSELSSETREAEMETLKGVCSMLLAFYRNLVSQASKSTILLASTANDLAKSRPVVMQYLPHLMSVYLWSNHSQESEEKRSVTFLEAFFLAVYNTEAADTQQAVQQQQSTTCMSCRVPGLSQSSIFHESDRLDAESIEKLNRRAGAGGSMPTLMEPVFKQVHKVSASNRGPILQLLWRAFVRHLPDISKYGIDQVCRTCLHILSTSSSRRVFIPAPILTEMLHFSYFCIYNGFQVQGNQLLDLIDERASANAWPSVLLVTSSIKRLSISHGPSQSSLNVTSTPGQLAKHMITNASFRTKKISDDIPKVLTDDENNVSTTHTTTSTSRMKSIVEENVGDEMQTELTWPPASAKPSKMSTNNNSNGGNENQKQHTSNKEKLMAKLPNSLKVTMTGKKERTHSETNDRDALTDKDEKRREKVDKVSGEKIGKIEKKKSGKLQVTSNVTVVSSGGGSPSPTSLNSGITFGRSQNGDGLSVSSKNIESIEQVEELIQMKKLPPETISIHSPESGTTLF